MLLQLVVNRIWPKREGAERVRKFVIRGPHPCFPKGSWSGPTVWKEAYIRLTTSSNMHRLTYINTHIIIISADPHTDFGPHLDTVKVPINSFLNQKKWCNTRLTNTAHLQILSQFEPIKCDTAFDTHNWSCVTLQHSKSVSIWAQQGIL